MPEIYSFTYTVKDSALPPATSNIATETVTVTVIPPGFNITSAAGPSGSISPGGTTSVLLGTNQTYTITSNTGFMVTALAVDGVILPGTSSYTFSNVTANRYINAYFRAGP